jgi:HK97 family phage major capsid protein
MRTIDDIQNDMQAIVNSAEADGRSLTDAECDRYEAFENEMKGAQRGEQIRARNAAYTSPVNALPLAGPDNGLDALRTSLPGTAENKYSKTFRNWMRQGGENSELAAATIRNDQSSGTPSQGGYLVPTTMRLKLVERLLSYGGLATVVSHYSTGDGTPVEWPTIDDTGNIGEIVVENGTFSSGADLVFGTNSLGAYEYATGGSGSTPIRIPWSLIQDSAFDIEGLVADLFAKRIGRIQAVHWVRGTGVAEPLGILTGKTPVQTAANNAGITYADLVTWIHSVDPAYRQNARWAFNDSTMAQIEKIVDSHGDPVFRGWGTDLGQGFQETRLLGFPVTIDQAFPNFVNNSSATSFGVFGDLKQGYVIRDVTGVRVAVNPYNRMQYRQTEMTGWARADGTQQDPNAYIALSGKS